MAEPTPLQEAATRAGAVLAEEAGWLLPGHFGNPGAEYRQALEHAALFDRSHHGKVELTGAEAARFLHNLCTNDINGLAVGAGCEAFLPTGQARLVGHALVYRVRLPDGGNGFRLDVGPGMGEKIARHLDHYLISEKVEIADRTQEWAQLHLAGPQAKTLLEQALPGTLPELAELQHLERNIGEIPCQVRRHEPLGLPGYDLLCPKEQAETLWQALLAAGARPAGLEAYQVLRLEAGTPVYGVDIDETNLPQEVARTEKAISFTKGCYIGQETVARIRTYGHVNRSLVGLKLTGDSVVASGAKLYRDGKEVGQVTSSVLSPRIRGPIALGYVRRGSQEAGTILEVEAPEGPRKAEVVALPF